MNDVIAQAQAPHQEGPTDQLQRLLFAVIGGEDASEVLPFVETQLQIVERELSQVPLRAQQQGADFLTQSQSQRESLLTQLGQYQGWLQQVKQALESQDHHQLVSAHEAGQEVMPGLHQAMAEYGALFAASGPYQSPWCNSLHRLGQSVAQGQTTDNTWVETIAGYLPQFQRRCQEIASLPLPGSSLVVEQYEQTIHSLIELQDIEDWGQLPARLGELEKHLVEAQRFELLMDQGRQGRTPVPATNVVLHVIDLAQSGQVANELASRFVADYRQLLDSFWENFEKGLTKPNQSALVQEEIPRTLEFGDSHDAAVEGLMDALQKQDQPAIARHLEELRATAQQLEESRQVYATASANQSQVVCPACGRANPPENRRCEACGAQLPQLEDPSASSTFSLVTGPALEENQELEMTENVAKLFQACDDVAAGVISSTEFADILRDAAAGLKDYAEELDEIAEDVLDESQMDEETLQVWREQHLPYVQELSAAFVDGIEACENGLALMQAYIEDPNPEHLIQGVRSVWEALNYMHRTRLSMDANLKMLQDILEEAREKGYLGDVSG